MTHRRAFIKQMASIAGASGLSGLLALDEAISAQLATLRPLADDASWAALRDRYLLAPDVIYFNHGSIGTIPRLVHAAQVAYLRTCESNPWLYMWGGAWDEPREIVRQKAAALLGCAAEELAITHNTTEGFNTLAAGLDLTEVRHLEDWLRSNTDASDVIASAWPARFYLTTGRRGFVFWPDTDPYARYYGPDRRWSAFYVLPSPSETRAMFEDMRAHMPRAYREAGIGCYVEQARLREAAVFAHLVKARPGAFDPAYATPRGDFRVYRVKLSAD